MGTPFVALLQPTQLVSGYKLGVPHDEQPANVPKLFCDAMEVREAVFVKEQGVPAENEFDADDSRSCHWVTYASINRIVERAVVDSENNIVSPQRSVTKSVPIGTIRVVPFPHDPHPKDGGVYYDGKLIGIKDETTSVSDIIKKHEAQNGQPKENGSASAGEHVGEDVPVSRPRPYISDRSTELHDGKEPYVKLGRLAVIQEFRGHRIAVILVKAALEWLKKNPGCFNPSIKELGLEAIGVDPEDPIIPKWNGLVCVHAQKQVVGLWEKLGFKVDEGMGTWWEEGIEHKGMFLRMETQVQLIPSSQF